MSDDDPLRDRASNGDEPDPGIGERLRNALPSVDLSGASDSGSRAGARATSTLTSPGAKKLYAALAVLTVTVVAFYYVMQSRGLVAAIVYTMLFGFAATLFPIGIALLGSAVPNSVGKLHMLLGAVAFDHHYLVQREHGYEWCPGEKGRVWIDEQWHDIKGEDNYSVLGWRPFGILRYKDGETWAQKRADQAGLSARPSAARERDPTADGGSKVVERGGVKEIARPVISGLDGTWLLDLKRVYTNGIRKIGDVELIETAEEVIERSQVDDGKMSNAGPLVETIGGLFLGILAGYGYIFLAG